MNFHPAQSEALGAVPGLEGTRFCVRSANAERIWVVLFDPDGAKETGRVELFRESPDHFATLVPGAGPGTRYGLRADGVFAPERGLWFDPQKLLVDPYAVSVDRPYRYDAALALPRGKSFDTAALMPKALVTALQRPPKLEPPRFRPGGLIYEIPVRAFSMLHPGIPETKRGTIAALAEPVLIDHLKKLGVDAVELMPVTATMDERHLPALGLSNAWGYNPVTFMALDPRLAPGGLDELRRSVAALHAADIGVILDLVFNHTAESDALGPTLSLRGLDAPTYYRHALDGRLVNDTGCGNTVACDQPTTRQLILDALRHLVLQAQVDGFRFDLAPVLGRTAHGFDPAADLLQAMRADPVVGSRVLIAEPWDIGPNGYQLGHFGKPFGEWNDRCRDEIRRFWRSDRGTVGPLASKLAGSFDIFTAEDATRSVNFVAAHDGMTLADLTAFERKHNEANGEQNRDGHNENFSWNNGVEGPTSDPQIAECRGRDIRALLATLFASRGAIMLTAGDEWGRSQGGNNNAYAQDNAAFWHDWKSRDGNLEAYVSALSALRRRIPALGKVARLTGEPAGDGKEFPDVVWLAPEGKPLGAVEWHEPERQHFAMVLDTGGDGGGRLAVCFNGDRRQICFALPIREGWTWAAAVETFPGEVRMSATGPLVRGRSVAFLEEKPV